MKGLLLSLQVVPPVFTIIFHLSNSIEKNHNDLMWSAENMMSESLPQSSTDKTLNLTEPAFSFFLVRPENDTISDVL